MYELQIMQYLARGFTYYNNLTSKAIQEDTFDLSHVRFKTCWKSTPTYFSDEKVIEVDSVFEEDVKNVEFLKFMRDCCVFYNYDTRDDFQGEHVYCFRKESRLEKCDYYMHL